MCFNNIIKWADPCPHSGEKYLIPCGEVTGAKAKKQCDKVVTYTSVSQAVCGRCGEGDKGVFEQDGNRGTTQDDWHSQKGEEKVRSWGYQSVFTWKDKPQVLPSRIVSLILMLSCSGVYYPPHSHDNKTIYLVLSGSITFIFPSYQTNKPTVRVPVPVQLAGQSPAVSIDANQLASKKLQVGECVEMDEGTEHEATVGDEGCTFVVGEGA